MVGKKAAERHIYIRKALAYVSEGEAESNKNSSRSGITSHGPTIDCELLWQVENLGTISTHETEDDRNTVRHKPISVREI
jgi:hypothetical protein